MGKRAYKKVCERITEEPLKVELIGVVDENSDAQARIERVQKYLTEMVLLGQKRGRPKLEKESDEKIAA
jgi:hypothetical protein